VVVNLNEERMSRYLRVKLVLAVDAEQEKAANEHLAKHKAQLKNWLIGHLSGKSIKDVAGSVGVKRMQREILEHFEDVLYPDGDGPLREVLFEEFVVQ
jgi:flagellar FliL protein